MSGNPQQRLPAYLRPGNIGLVFIGGALGVFARQGLMLLLPDAAGLPVAVLVANLVGAFLLGLLLESISRRAAESAHTTSARLLLGTGLLGGFTTYSALAASVMLLGAAGQVWLAVGYGLGTVLLGGVATWCGVLLGAVLMRGKRARDV